MVDLALLVQCSHGLSPDDLASAGADLLEVHTELGVGRGSLHHGSTIAPPKFISATTAVGPMPVAQFTTTRPHTDGGALTLASSNT